MRQAVLALWAVLTLGGCVITETQGPVLSTVPKPVSCLEPTLRGALEKSAARVRVSLVGERTCHDATVSTYRLGRTVQFSDLGKGLIMGATALATAVACLSLYGAASGPRHWTESTTSTAIGTVLTTLSLGAGFLLGILPAAASRELEPSTFTSERPGVEDTRAVPVQGSLVAPTGREWPLVEGVVELEVGTFSPDELEDARVNGVVVAWSDDALAVMAELMSCQRAVKGWSAGEALDCARVEPALRCTESGFSLAKSLLAQAETACPRKAEAVSPAPARLPTPAPEVPCVLLPSCVSSPSPR